MPIMVEEYADPIVLIFLIAMCILILAVVIRILFNNTVEAIDEFIADRIRGDD